MRPSSIQEQASSIQITDPRHPLQMDLSAARMAERKWLRIADADHRPHVISWARRNAAFHTARAEEALARIAKQKGGVA